MADDRTLGQVLHEARQAEGEQRPRPWPVEDWEDRDPRLQAVDEAMAAAVAVRAVHDAGLVNTRRDAQLFALGAHLPAVLDALRLAAADAADVEYGARAKRFTAALEALGGSKEDEGHG